jgi:hypothetical protein
VRFEIGTPLDRARGNPARCGCGVGVTEAQGTAQKKEARGFVLKAIEERWMTHSLQLLGVGAKASPW